MFYTLGQGNDYVEVGGKKKHVMSYLEDFLFHPARAQSPVSSLSGGERNRLLLAKLFTRPANILVLDEPTNDLDIDTQELLEDLLRDYQGTVFLSRMTVCSSTNVITQSIVFEGQGRLKEYIGGYQDYIDAKSREDKIQTASAPKAVAEPEKVKPKANRTVKLSYKEQRELDALPDEIAALKPSRLKSIPSFPTLKFSKITKKQVRYKAGLKKLKCCFWKSWNAGNGWKRNKMAKRFKLGILSQSGADTFLSHAV